jgi:hypothetical protein
MQKVDRVVALLGALVLVAAVGVAATQEGGGGQHVLSYTLVEERAQVTMGPSPLPSNGGTFEAPIDVETANVSKVNVTVTFNAVNAAGGSVRVVLKAPNGTIMAEEEQSLGTPSPGNSVGYTASLEVVLAPLPADTRGATYPSREAAEAALAQGVPEAAGTWLAELSFAPGPTPALQVEVAFDARALMWASAVEPVAPESR